MASSPSTMIPAAGAKTSSTHRASFVHGTHRFHLDGYSLLKARDGTSNIISDEFEIAGHRWTMACCFKDHILERVSLRLLPPIDQWGSVRVTATATFTIQHPSGEPRADMQIGSSRPQTFSRDSTLYRHSVPRAFQRNKDTEARYVKDDRLTVCCTVHVWAKEDSDSSAAATRNCFVAAPPPPTITRSLLELLETGRGSDVAFQLAADGSEPFKAHKLVLAMRSPVFAAKFFGDTMDSRQSLFRIEDMSAPVFAAMLRFVYADDETVAATLAMAEADPDDDAAAATSFYFAYDLLVAADLYDLERLRVACEKKLSERVQDVPTAMSMLALVNGRQLEDLSASAASPPTPRRGSERWPRRSTGSSRGPRPLLSTTSWRR